MDHSDPKPDYRVVRRLRSLVERISKHWARVNAKFPPASPLMVLEDVDLAAFSALPAKEDALRKALRERLQEQEVVTFALHLAKVALRKRLAWLRSFVRGYWAGSAWEKLLPVLPDARAGADEFLGPMRSAALVWSGIAALPPPVPGAEPVMPDGCDAAKYAAELAEVQLLWEGRREREREVRLARGALEVFHRHAAAAIAGYGHSARGRLMPGDPLLESLPRLWPKRGGANGE